MDKNADFFISADRVFLSHPSFKETYCVFDVDKRHNRFPLGPAS